MNARIFPPAADGRGAADIAGRLGVCRPAVYTRVRPFNEQGLEGLGDRDESRVRNIEVVDRAFALGRRRRVEATLHRSTIDRARVMMGSEQLKAFEVAREPMQLRRDYGETPFGRACLAARRLIEVGVRCVEWK